MTQSYVAIVAAITSVSLKQNSNAICVDGGNIYPSDHFREGRLNYRSDTRVQKSERAFRSVLTITTMNQTELCDTKFIVPYVWNQLSKVSEYPLKRKNISFKRTES